MQTKSIFTFLITLLLATASFAQTTPTDPAQDPAALTNAFFKALLDEDGTINKYMTTDFNLTSFDGQSIDGELLAQAVSGGAVVVETATVSNARTRQYNSDAAVTTGTWQAKGNVQGQGFEQSVTFSAVSVKQGSGWKIANIQFTPVR